MATPTLALQDIEHAAVGWERTAPGWNCKPVVYIHTCQRYETEVGDMYLMYVCTWPKTGVSRPRNVALRIGCRRRRRRPRFGS